MSSKKHVKEGGFLSNCNHHYLDLKPFSSFLTHVRCGLLTVFACGWALTAVAQTPLPDSFDPKANGYVHSIAVQADGKILVCGQFLMMCGVTRNRIARLSADGTLDAAFNPNASYYVDTITVQADGKILAGGAFSKMGGVTRNRIARLNADGTLDTAFNPNASNNVCSIVVQADGKILVGGWFTTMGGVARNYIARLNADGTLDAAFNPNANDWVNSISVQVDGKILVGGRFTTMGGVARNRIARLNADGTLDNAFNPNANSSVNSLTVQADGKILVGGWFTTMGGWTRNNIARLNVDGTLDNAFNPNASYGVYSIVVQSDGKILAGGGFATMGGVTRNSIARLNADGTLDNAFNPDANHAVISLAVQADGKALVGGQFTTMGGVTRNGIARLTNSEPATEYMDYSGTRILWLRGGTGPEVWRTTFEHSADGVGYSMLGAGSRVTGGWELNAVSFTGGTIRARGYIAGGQYSGSGGIVERGLSNTTIFSQPESRTNNAGTTASFSAVVGGFGPLVYRWRKDGVELPDGGYIFGSTTATLRVSEVLHGDMGGYDVVACNGYGSVTSVVATLTVVDPAINVQSVSQAFQMGDNATLSVTAAGTGLTYQWWKDGLLLIGATNTVLNMTSIQGADAGNYSIVVCGAYGSVTSAVVVVSVNLASVDAAFNANAGSSVYALAVQSDGKMLAGGSFTRMGGVPRNRIARLKADATLDTTFNPNAGSEVYALAVQADGKILAGGWFMKMGEVTRNCIARLNADGTLDNAFNPNASHRVYSLAVQADGKILVGGQFTTMGGVTRNYIARLNADGALDVAFNPNASYLVYSLALQKDGKILIGGGFTTVGGVARNFIARLNADGTLDDAFNPAASSEVYSLAVQADGKILVGGGFTTISGVTRNRIARLNADGTLDTDFNPIVNGYYVLSLALQADGKILAGGNFTAMGGVTRNYMARLSADGTLDAAFNPNVDSIVNSLALQADGKILAGGNFTAMGGVTRNYMARLNSPGPVVDTLCYEGETVTWLRGGNASEVWRTTFEYATNGISWTILGEGARIPGGWQLAGVSATGSVIRARGYTTGGEYNGSGGIVESIWGGTVITTTVLATATVGVSYSATLQASSGVPPYCWTVLPNNGFVTNGFLPAGLQLSTNGVITGIPAAAGVYWPTFVVSDSVGCIASTNIMMRVAVSLNILSDHGIMQSSTAVTNYGVVVSESLTNSPVVNGTTQYVCKGWSLAGVLATNGQASGATTTVEMMLTNNATLTWLWTTNYWFQREAGADGSVSGDTNGWYSRDSQMTVTATGDNTHRLAYWAGDVPAGHTNDNPLILTMDTARFVTAHFTIITLVDALNCTCQTWTTGGSSVWWGQALTNHDGISSAQSGVIVDRQTSWFQTPVYGAGDLSFWWKVSSEADFDFLRFKVDGATWREISGETGWQFVSLRVEGSGLHMLEWSYTKDKDSLEGFDAGWVDQVSWVPNGFALWMQSKGLLGGPTTAFASDRNSDNIANGVEYAFGTNWSFGEDMLSIRLVNSEPVVEFPMQDSNTIPYVSLTLKGCTNLLCLPGDWTLQTAPATNTTGKPANRNWYVPVGHVPTNAFFRINATLLP
jgi:uncharacterized delta-60 repeat protein